MPNCCSNGGAWEKQCVSVPAPGKHTWEDGFNACRSLSFAKQQLANPKTNAEKTAGGKGGKGADAKGGSGAGEAASTALGLEDTVSEDDQNKNLLAEAIVGETRKCDSEREEWCAVILALILTLTRSVRSGATGRPILTLTLTLSLTLNLTLTLTLTRSRRCSRPPPRQTTR